MPGCRCAAIVSTARDDVGHVGVFGLAQRRRHADVDRVDTVASWLKSVVADSRPASRSARTSRVGHVRDVGRPSAIDGAIFAASRSNPMASKPLRANSTRSGRPTYPRPTTPTRAVRSVSRFFSAIQLASWKKLSLRWITDPPANRMPMRSGANR